MRTFRSGCGPPDRPRRLFAVVAALVMVVGALAGLSAHVVRGLAFPAYATAFVSSPSAGADAPIPILWGAQDTGLRVVCFNVANSSPPLAGAPEWPRVIGAGFELPGTPAGFSLLSPTDGAWELDRGRRAAGAWPWRRRARFRDRGASGDASRAAAWAGGGARQRDEILRERPVSRHRERRAGDDRNVASTASSSGSRRGRRRERPSISGCGSIPSARSRCIPE